MTVPDSRMPTTPANIAFVAPCPSCGRDVPWRGTWREAGTGTEYRIDCLRCDEELTPRLKETA